jgi:hypothetical protein
VIVAVKRHILRELVLMMEIRRQTTVVAATVPVALVPLRKNTWIPFPSRTPMRLRPLHFPVMESVDLEH